MNVMEEKDMILKAIDAYDVYNTASKSVLKTLVASPYMEDNVVKISINALAELSKLSRQGVYNALKYIERDNIVERFKKSGERVVYFKVNKNKIAEISQYYSNLQKTKKALL
jgi:DNA-binding transcriptional regulator GbsR (MarR family)